MQGSNKSTDQELLREYKMTENRQLIGDLFRRYSHLVVGLSHNYLKDKELAKDAVMDIFEFLLTNVQKYDIDNFKSWLLTLTRNHCLKALSRSIKKEKELFDKNTLVDSVEYYEEADQDNEEALNRLELALDTLKPHQQQCISLFYLKGKSYEEVSALTNYELKQVKSYIQNGKLNLAKSLKM